MDVVSYAVKNTFIVIPIIFQTMTKKECTAKTKI